jgi:hypothetical protein
LPIMPKISAGIDPPGALARSEYRGARIEQRQDGRKRSRERGRRDAVVV